MIFANSPEAKGRIESACRTVQDRLCPELRINKIKSMPEANRYLQEQFLPKYWRQSCVVKASSDQPAYEAKKDDWIKRVYGLRKNLRKTLP